MKKFVYLVVFFLFFSLIGMEKAEGITITKKTQTLYISVDVGNVRKGPDTTYAVVKKLKRGTKVTSVGYTKNKSGTVWHQIELSKTQRAWASSTILTSKNPAKKVLLNAPLIKQMPQLPRGCEVTSLAMMLNYAGVKADKMKLAREVKKDTTPYQKKNGKIYFGNPYNGFVGDMYTFKKPGFGVYHGPIAQLANKYLPNRIINLTGKSFESIYPYLDKGTPVWVITNTRFNTLPASYFQTWETPTGKVRITYKEHSVLITGYDNQYIYFNDPLSGTKNRKVAINSFKNGWIQMGKQAITYRK